LNGYSLKNYLHPTIFRRPSSVIRYASYLFDVLLEKRSSPYNPILKLYLSRGQLKLMTKHAVYSYGNRYYNFRDSFYKLKIGERNIKDVLILGLGTGSIIQILEQKFRIQARYDVIELDQVVVELFEKYRNGFITSNCEVHVGDAFEFMKTNQKKYDLVCMDIFSDNIVPEIFETSEFLLNLNRALKEKGVLLFNRLNVDDSDKVKNETFYKNFQKEFPDATLFKLEYNWMFIVDRLRN
jgi:predicted membrane-bound spermidine synthase